MIELLFALLAVPAAPTLGADTVEELLVAALAAD